MKKLNTDWDKEYSREYKTPTSMDVYATPTEKKLYDNLDKYQTAIEIMNICFAIASILKYKLAKWNAQRKINKLRIK